MIDFIHRYLDPQDSLVELLFGLVMSLTMTVGARLLWDEDPASVRELVLALVGCNLAWGIIDGMFYLLGARFGRRRAMQFAERLRRARGDAEALALVEREIDLDETILSDPRDRAKLRQLLAAVLRRAPARPARNTARELAAAGVVGVLVTVAALPGALPLVLFDDARSALTVANALQVALLFGVGYAWAHFAGASPLRAGTSIALLGVVLVGVAVALGG